ncbi:MAG: ATP-binding protein [Promethearchaeota archaeon]
MKLKKHFFETYSAYLSVGLILLFSSSLWVADISQRQSFLNQRSSTAADDLVDNFSHEIGDRLESLSLLHEIWLNTQNVSLLYEYDRYLTIVPQFFEINPGLLAINWIDINGTIKWIYPIAPNVNASNKNIRYLMSGDINEAFAHAESSGEMGITGLVNFFQGGFGVVTYDPLICNGTLTGYFNAVFDFSLLFHELIEGNDSVQGISDYSLTLSSNENIIYQLNENFTRDDAFTRTRNFILFNVPLSVDLRPNRDLRSRVSFFNNFEIMALGISLSLVVGILINILGKKVIIIRENANEKEKLMEDLNVKQKMTSLGTLAGGIAHDFNNLLGGIRGYTSLLELNATEILEDKDIQSYPKLQDLQECGEYIGNINELITRSENITKQIISFSRSKDVKYQILDIHSIMRDTITTFMNLIDKRFKIVVEFHPNDIYLLGESTYFSQILMNLLMNARDAIHSSTQGTITISTKLIPHELEDEKGKKMLKIANGDYTPPLQINDIHDFELNISDTGVGIPKHIQDKIYDPFFTTKKSEGKGSGLGLTIVYNYVQNLGGIINFSSEIGRGTEFNLVFPLVQTPKNPILEKKSLIRSPTLSLDYSKMNILLVEDEVMIRNSLEIYFKKKGAKVKIASDGIEGLTIFREPDTEFSLIILDVNMPGMNGVEIYKKIKKEKPTQPILFITGYSSYKVPENDPYDLGILYKPFEFTVLAEKLQLWQTSLNSKS